MNTESAGTPDAGEAVIDAVAATARLPAALRAAESARPDRLFHDPFAARLAGAAGEELLDQLGMRDSPIIPVRTRYFDDTITGTAAGGIRQIVVVAAGMDTRAYRLGLPDDTVLFELDRPNLLRLKGELLGAAMPSGTREPIGVDLATNFTVPLVDAGFRADRPTCWLVEGLTQYLTESDVHRMIDRISSHSAIGSHLLIDFIGTSLLESPAMSPMLDRLAERSMTWQYGTEEPETLLEHRGWRATVTRIGTVGTAMNRWPFPDAPRGTPGVPQGYLVHATA
jgi:methyltransferase (TIGR00027 family)